MEETFKIRKMEKKDLPEVLSIEQACFSSPWTEKSFQDAMMSGDNIYLVALSSEKVAGYCGLWLSFENADLCNMAVHPAMRNRGVGAGLLSQAKKIAAERGVKKVLLEVRQQNVSAIALYRKLGFEQIGIRKGYYSAPMEDALLMEKIL